MTIKKGAKKPIVKLERFESMVPEWPSGWALSVDGISAIDFLDDGRISALKLKRWKEASDD